MICKSFHIHSNVFLLFCPHCLTIKLNIKYFENGLYVNSYLTKEELRRCTLTHVPVQSPKKALPEKNTRSTLSPPSNDVTPSARPKMNNKAPTIMCVMARNLTIDTNISKQRLTKRWKPNIIQLLSLKLFDF